MVEAPNDVRGWMLLGRGYLTMGDAEQAAKAFAQGLALQKTPDASLLSAYGEALVLSANGAVTAEAEKAFKAALAQNAKDFGARYYLGLASLQRGNPREAETLWQSLVSDMPSTEPFRAFVLDRLAQVKSQNGGGVDIQAMVEGLAARLKAEPKDGEGWRRLIRAYTVLGDTEKAKAALQEGRSALAADVPAREALEQEARDLKLN
jgi:cytochrome c-type biogenesis protein CcmH